MMSLSNIRVHQLRNGLWQSVALNFLFLVNFVENFLTRNSGAVCKASVMQHKVWGCTPIKSRWLPSNVVGISIVLYSIHVQSYNAKL